MSLTALPLRVLLLAAGLWLGVASGLGAQGPGGGPPLAAQGRQNLAFGELLGGLPRRIPPTDPASAGQFRVRIFRRTAQVSFLLPTVLQRAGGGELPLSFGPGDAFFSRSGREGDAVYFDPTVGIVLSGASAPGWSWIHVGGTVLPPHNAPLGAYSGTLVLTLADLGS